MSIRILAKLLEKHLRFRGALIFQVASLPELIKIGPAKPPSLGQVARYFIYVPDPFARASSFAKQIASAEARGEFTEYLKVVAGAPDSRDCSFHRHDESISRARADIVALQGRRRR